MLIHCYFGKLLRLLSLYYYQIYPTFLGNVLDTNILDISTQISNYLYTIILVLAQYCSTRLQ